MHDHDPTAVQPQELARWESPAIRDAITGLTGNLGVEVCARVLDGQCEAQHAVFSDSPGASEQVAVGAA
jgi:hypothetical protein